MKNYNLLLWGAAAYFAFRYLKRRKSGAVGVDVLPEALQPLTPVMPYGKPGTVVNVIVPEVTEARAPQQSRMAPEGSMPIPPSQGFKPGML
jgi:hypothetical protein